MGGPSTPMFGSPTAIPLVTASHAEFVDWARTKGGLDGRIVDFLASREDCAGSTPAGWQRLSAALSAPGYSDLAEGVRHDLTVELIGSEALNAFTDWSNGRG